MSKMLTKAEAAARRQLKSTQIGGGGANYNCRNNGISTPPPATAAPNTPPPATQHAIRHQKPLQHLPPGNLPVASAAVLAQLSEAYAHYDHLVKVHHYTQMYLPRLALVAEMKEQLTQQLAIINDLHSQLQARLQP